MTYQIRRNFELTKGIEQTFTAKNFSSAVNKVTDALKSNATLALWAFANKKNLSAIAEDMVVELGKE